MQEGRLRKENSDDIHAGKELEVTWIFVRCCTFNDGNDQEIRAPYSSLGLAKGASEAEVLLKDIILEGWAYGYDDLYRAILACF